MKEHIHTHIMETHRMGEIFVNNCFAAAHIKYTWENGFCERSVVTKDLICPQKNCCRFGYIDRVAPQKEDEKCSKLTGRRFCLTWRIQLRRQCFTLLLPSLRLLALSLIHTKNLFWSKRGREKKRGRVIQQVLKSSACHLLSLTFI